MIWLMYVLKACTINLFKKKFMRNLKNCQKRQKTAKSIQKATKKLLLTSTLRCSLTRPMICSLQFHICHNNRL